LLFSGGRTAKGDLELTIDGRRRAINHIEPKGKTAEIAAFISAHL
jgi:hypothetical protein